MLNLNDSFSFHILNLWLSSIIYHKICWIKFLLAKYLWDKNAVNNEEEIDLLLTSLMPWEWRTADSNLVSAWIVLYVIWSSFAGGSIGGSERALHRNLSTAFLEPNDPPINQMSSGFVDLKVLPLQNRGFTVLCICV